MPYSFRIDSPALAGTLFLVERDALETSGGPETEFLDRAARIERHGARPLPVLAAELAAAPGVATLAIIRNPALVLDAGLPGRIGAALAMLAPLDGQWSLAAAGGLTPTGARVCALYSSETPFLPHAGGPRPIVDPLPDLYLVDAAWLRALATTGRALPDSGFEAVAALQGYLSGRVALALPGLTAGVLGPLRPRDPVKLELDLQDWFEADLAGTEVPTLMGPVRIERPLPAPGARPDPRPPAPRHDLARAIERVVETHCAPLSLSIVTRTRLSRPHLLDRLLTSITRARREGMALEVVLSSDAPRDACDTAMAGLAERFPNLTLRLQHNPAEGHSRVTNLLAGLNAATGRHVAIMDDDDYVDLFGFDEMARALFLGAAPLMVTNSVVHDEEWTETGSGRHQLNRSTERMRYPASGWRQMFGGVNKLPVCAFVMPRDRLLARLAAFEFRHDLSEDYTLWLLLLTDPELPEVVELPGAFGHISLRAGEGHSVMLQDRRPWARDISAYLAELTAAPAVAGPGQWQLIAGAEPAQAALDARAVAELRDALAARERELRLARAELARLRDAALAAPAALPQRPGKEAAA